MSNEVESVPTPSPSVGFASLGLADPIVKAVLALGYEEATPIQREAIPVLLAGKDIIGQAGTGTGKTAAFALPLLHRLFETPPVKKGVPRAMILVPTRELAMQVAEAIHKYAKQTSLSVVPMYGGSSMEQQIRALRRGVEVVVATPGRALDHIRRQTLDLAYLEVMVLDEADEMLDMGFAEDLDAILTATPETRQTALFAATMAPRIVAIATRHLRSPERITIKAEKRAAGKMPRVRQAAYIVSRQQKGFALGRILEFEDPASAIVFCRTRIEVDELTDTLKSHGYGAQALHGGLDQRQRDRVMQLFRTGKADVLVATDVAARGLDIDHVSHVINYDIPTAAEVYVHRIGRTGRIGREGVAITLVDPREQRTLRFIENLTKQKIEIATLPTLAALKAKRLDATRTAIQARLTAGDLDEMRTLVQTLAADFDMADIAAAAVAMYQTETDTPATSAPDIPPAPPRSSRPFERGGRDRDERPARPSSRPAYGAKSASAYGARSERPERSDRPSSFDKPDRAPRQDYSERPARPARPAATERPDRAADTERPVRPARPARPTGEDRPDRAERPERRSTSPRAGVGSDDTKVVLAFSVGRNDGVRPADLVGAITGEAGITSKELGAIRINPDFSVIEVDSAVASKVAKAMKGKTIRGEKVDVKKMD